MESILELSGPFTDPAPIRDVLTHCLRVNPDYYDDVSPNFFELQGTRDIFDRITQRKELLDNAAKRNEARERLSQLAAVIAEGCRNPVFRQESRARSAA